MIGQTDEIAPLDRRLYALRDVTGTVPVIQLIAASIMSKKLAEGLTGLLLDVKVGSGAFIPEGDRARELARTMVDIGARRGVPTVALLTAMDRPLGVALGNGLETAEAIACLKGGGPPDLRELVLAEVAEMVCLADSTMDAGEARSRAAGQLDSGSALDRFGRMVEAQGGDRSIVDEPERLHTAPHQVEVLALSAGRVATVAPRALGDCIARLGGGRLRMDQVVHPGVGFEVYARPGQELARGELLGRVHARSPSDAELGAKTLRECVETLERGAAWSQLPLVLGRITKDEGTAEVGAADA
jgi:thymidine phosphorylase